MRVIIIGNKKLFGNKMYLNMMGGKNHPITQSKEMAQINNFVETGVKGPVCQKIAVTPLLCKYHVVKNIVENIDHAGVIRSSFT